jgi:predicted DNA-binding transcriptional regulator YafY
MGYFGGGHMGEEKKEKEARCNHKLKIMYLMKILMDRTDETHDITLSEIEDALRTYGISAERKSLYSDIENLRLYGMDIIGIQYDRTYHYKVVNREFELAELKLLVDSVQSAKFITEKKSNELIKKIESFASKYEAAQLDRQVKVNGRVKSENTHNYYNVDAIHEAISHNNQIQFRYFVWTVDKKMELKHDGAFYHVSPWALCWDDEKYYLIGYDNDAEKIKYFRVDKMTETSVVNAPRQGKSEFAEIDMAEYTNRLFGMFAGDAQTVQLYCENEMANVIIDRFGKDIPIIKTDAEHFTVSVKVSVSQMFLGWIMALDGVKIISPDSVVDKMKERIMQLYRMYI